MYRILSGELEVPKHYKIGKPCVKGHSLNGKGLRYTSDSACVHCRCLSSKRRQYRKVDGEPEITKLQIDHLKTDQAEAKMMRQLDNYYEELLCEL